MKILVVDDSSTMRMILKKCLNGANFKDVVQAGDGLEALRILTSQGDIGLVLADWHMPNMDGIALLKEMKKNESIKDIPVIMVTTQAEKQSVVKALNIGAASYVVKPFTPETIQKKIEEVLE